MLRFLTAGESHGQALTTLLEGIPAGLPLRPQHINEQLARRQRGYGRGGRMKIETDTAQVLSGVRHGFTLGTPISLLIQNRDWKNWEQAMAVEPVEAPPDPITVPRPGHADLSGLLKYGYSDIRNVIERASARETTARVAAGAVCRRLLEEVGVRMVSRVVQIGPALAQDLPEDLDENITRTESSEVRCTDPRAAAEMMGLVDAARKEGNTLGGTFEVLVDGLPIGLGSYTHWDRKLDGLLAQSLMSIHAIKGVEIGLGFACGGLMGSKVHDAISYQDGRFRHSSNNAGGLEGGVTNGERLVLRACMKPISTLVRPLMSVDVASKEAVESRFERSDICAVPAAGVVGEAMVALTLAQSLLEKFGGDSLAELTHNLEGYRAALAAR
ncbi:MAG TPA: chorismate synthase [Armatimonadota bacterium]|jgi:chorismate synthase